MSKYRAIMTTTDRKRISGKSDVSTEKKYQTIHRIRSRIEELTEDAAVLEENNPKLYKELREAVCENE
jgi:hypothetical protein